MLNMIKVIPKVKNENNINLKLSTWLKGIDKT